MPFTFSYIVPSGAPLNFHAVNMSSNNFTLIWDLPVPSERNGIIIGYTISVTSLSSPLEEPRLFSTAAEFLIVDFLNPHTEYVCMIAADTAIGTGPFSTELNVWTEQDGMPVNLKYALIHICINEFFPQHLTILQQMQME